MARTLLLNYPYIYCKCFITLKENIFYYKKNFVKTETSNVHLADCQVLFLVHYIKVLVRLQRVVGFINKELALGPDRYH